MAKKKNSAFGGRHFKYKDIDKDRSKAHKDPGQHVPPRWQQPLIHAEAQHFDSMVPRRMPKISERMKAERRASQAKTQAYGRSKVRHK